MNKLYNWKELKDYKNVNEDTSDGYYHFGKDLYNFPDAWCYIVWSRRGPGKTYSALWNHVYNNIPIIYMKRTVEDVDAISDADASEDKPDLSPYCPINRDKLTTIKPIKISKGLGAFYKAVDDEGVLKGLPISYVMALNKIKSVKGFEASNVEWIFLDEFIPQIGEIVRRKEGEQLLDLYMTVLRDKVARGGKELKLVLFANSENISSPITNTLEVVDYMAELQNSDKNIMYIEDKKILLHRIVPEEVPAITKQDEQLGIFKALGNTAWGRKSFGGDFANNDFSNVVKMSLKGMKPYIKLIYRSHSYYIYLNPNNGVYYMSESANKCLFEYDLNKENDQKSFYGEHCIDLREACIEDKMKFQKYSMYDLIVNYTKHFNL